MVKNIYETPTICIDLYKGEDIIRTSGGGDFMGNELSSFPENKDEYVSSI